MFLVTRNWYEEGDFWKIDLVSPKRIVVGFKKSDKHYMRYLIIFTATYIGSKRALLHGETAMLLPAGIHIRPDGCFETYWQRDARRAAVTLMCLWRRSKWMIDKNIVRIIISNLFALSDSVPRQNHKR